MHILNIGLVTSLDRFKGADLPQGAILTAEQVLDYLAGYGFKVLWHKVAQSDTEPTLIVGIHAHGMTMGDIHKINKLSNLLQQDCIAAFDAINGKGYLIGDYAEDWGGEFNPAYFILG